MLLRAGEVSLTLGADSLAIPVACDFARTVFRHKYLSAAQGGPSPQVPA